MPFIAYLDEFGHIGPYLSYDHPQHNTHPAFGLGGIVLPFHRVRDFSTFFFKSKQRLLNWEIEKSNRHPAQWEKKGAALYTTKNVESYPELSRMTHRILNKIRSFGGFVFYVGYEKRRVIESNDSYRRYSNVLREVIKRLNQEAENHDTYFSIVLDKQEAGEEFRSHIVSQASIAMYGGEPYMRMIEPPIEAESHLFQTLQCADWICGLVGRMAHYQFDSHSRPDFAWAHGKLGKHLKQISIRSSLR